MDMTSDLEKVTAGSVFGEAIFDLVRRAATDLPPDVEKALREAHEKEKRDSRAQQILSMYLDNIARARERQVALCQDTGLPIFFIRCPVGLSQRRMAKTCEEAVAKATEVQYLRPNAVDPVTGKNSGTSVGPGSPVFYFEEGDEDALTVSLMLKGGGSENVCTQYSLPDGGLKAGRDLEGVRRVLLDATRRAEGKGCAPGILGVCIGGDRSSGYNYSKHQLLRRLDDMNPDPALADLENRVLKEGNMLGIGPLGLGGETTLLGVKIGSLHRHPACYFVTITYMCWECRRWTIRIEADGAWRYI
jgi:fumarate hydratase, class I